MAEPAEIELVFEPQEEGGYHVYAPELPGLHTQGDDLDDAIANAEEAPWPSTSRACVRTASRSSSA
jgi:HicB_like antitoxin of bacterial toxin-antitoxin system